jgi:hypothetical protein
MCDIEVLKKRAELAAANSNTQLMLADEVGPSAASAVAGATSVVVESAMDAVLSVSAVGAG